MIEDAPQRLVHLGGYAMWLAIGDGKAETYEACEVLARLVLEITLPIHASTLSDA